MSVHSQSFSSSSTLNSEAEYPSLPSLPSRYLLAQRLHAESQHVFPQQIGAERGGRQNIERKQGRKENRKPRSRPKPRKGVRSGEKISKTAEEDHHYKRKEINIPLRSAETANTIWGENAHQQREKGRTAEYEEELGKHKREAEIQKEWEITKQELFIEKWKNFLLSSLLLFLWKNMEKSTDLFGVSQDGRTPSSSVSPGLEAQTARVSKNAGLPIAQPI